MVNLMKTRYGVYTDIRESDYIVEFQTVVVENLKLYFTSPNNKRKFLRKWNIEQSRISDYVGRLYGFTVHLHLLSIIKIYQQTEKRGFRVSYKGVETLCPENILFSTSLHFKTNSKN